MIKSKETERKLVIKFNFAAILTSIPFDEILERSKTYEMIVHIKDLNKIKEWVESDLTSDVVNRRSVTSLIYEYNSVVFVLKSKKHNGVTDYTDRADIQTYFMGIKRVKQYRIFKAFL